MKLRVFLAILFLISCTPIVTVASRASNFSFVYKFTPCGSIPLYVLDSTSDILIYAPLDKAESIEISFHLEADELESIYQKANSIDFFEYPSEFVIPDDQLLGIQAPVSTYELSMRNDKTSNSVRWVNDNFAKPEYTEDDKLRELLDLIYGLIQSRLEIQQLPEPKVGCA